MCIYIYIYGYGYIQIYIPIYIYRKICIHLHPTCVFDLHSIHAHTHTHTHTHLHTRIHTPRISNCCAISSRSILPSFLRSNRSNTRLILSSSVLSRPSLSCAGACVQMRVGAEKKGVDSNMAPHHALTRMHARDRAPPACTARHASTQTRKHANNTRNSIAIAPSLLQALHFPRRVLDHPPPAVTCTSAPLLRGGIVRLVFPIPLLRANGPKTVGRVLQSGFPTNSGGRRKGSQRLIVGFKVYMGVCICVCVCERDWLCSVWDLFTLSRALFL